MSAGARPRTPSCSVIVFVRYVMIGDVRPAGVADANGMPASHTRSPFGCRIRKHGSDSLPGFPLNSPFGENICVFCMSNDPQSSAYSFTSGADGVVLAHPATANATSPTAIRFM